MRKRLTALLTIPASPLAKGKDGAPTWSYVLGIKLLSKKRN